MDSSQILRKNTKLSCNNEVDAKQDICNSTVPLNGLNDFTAQLDDTFIKYMDNTNSTKDNQEECSDKDKSVESPDEDKSFMETVESHDDETNVTLSLKHPDELDKVPEPKESHDVIDNIPEPKESHDVIDNIPEPKESPHEVDNVIEPKETPHKDAVMTNHLESHLMREEDYTSVSAKHDVTCIKTETDKNILVDDVKNAPLPSQNVGSFWNNILERSRLQFWNLVRNYRNMSKPNK